MNGENISVPHYLATDLLMIADILLTKPLGSTAFFLNLRPPTTFILNILVTNGGRALPPRLASS